MEASVLIIVELRKARVRITRLQQAFSVEKLPGFEEMESEGRSFSEEERIGWLALKLVPELGNRSILRLVRHFGSAHAVFQSGLKGRFPVEGIRENALAALRRKEFIREPELEWEILNKEGIRMICLNDPDYPSNLAVIPDPPAVLFVRGALESRDLVSIAVVGSRAASPTGRIFTEKLSRELAGAGVTIVSGLAVGIDSAAHRGALAVGGRTIAVLGCGLDVDYPRGSEKIRCEIAGSGAVVSEFPLKTPPAAAHFPMRNRIISGLALGVVVVEAAQRSGSLITARLALEQGREVFAVPGHALNFRSAGPNRLLKEGAKLVENAEDVLEEIRPLIRSSGKDFSPKPPEPARTPDLSGLSSDNKTILSALDENPRHIDEIARIVELPVSHVTAVLLSLELQGIVEQLPGKYFVHIQGNSCRKK